MEQSDNAGRPRPSGASRRVATCADASRTGTRSTRSSSAACSGPAFGAQGRLLAFYRGATRIHGAAAIPRDGRQGIAAAEPVRTSSR